MTRYVSGDNVEITISNGSVFRGVVQEANDDCYVLTDVFKVGQDGVLDALNQAVRFGHTLIKEIKTPTLPETPKPRFTSGMFGQQPGHNQPSSNPSATRKQPKGQASAGSFRSRNDEIALPFPHDPDDKVDITPLDLEKERLEYQRRREDAIRTNAIDQGHDPEVAIRAFNRQYDPSRSFFDNLEPNRRNRRNVKQNRT
ncbi:hypothetical protein GMRT_10206 [Giardia muris]|uniref:Uncharacterized protein n=1 Tax=Giardia muris TaxID=5742 RepID=A0A4Z1TAF5_GIAMU|nr:hypothetical protein GMRT_10206 [Giardia muris]|eukprot:TNJ29501.1 hypothetical protein GMRT_10206 [Giardia muris]